MTDLQFLSLTVSEKIFFQWFSWSA